MYGYQTCNFMLHKTSSEIMHCTKLYTETLLVFVKQWQQLPQSMTTHTHTHTLQLISSTPAFYIAYIVHTCTYRIRYKKVQKKQDLKKCKNTRKFREEIWRLTTHSCLPHIYTFQLISSTLALYIH